MPDNDTTNMLDNLSEHIDSLGGKASFLGQELNSLQSELDKAQASSSKFSKTLSSEISGALKDVILKGENVGETFKNLAITMANNTLNSTISNTVDSFSNLIGSGIANLLPFENGGVISHGNVKAFANGGIVESPTNFGLQNGIGLMGESGPEAIIPLSRGADGKLGIAKTSDSRPVNISITISTPDVVGFNKSKSQISAQLSRDINNALSKR